jgi:hypothetical protein
MALPGQLKTKIDLMKKKIAEQGESLPPERQRRLRKSLKRLQRARRTALATEKKSQAPAAAAETPEGESQASPSA